MSTPASPLQTELAGIRETVRMASNDSDPVRPFDVGIDLEEQLEEQLEERAGEEELNDSEDDAAAAPTSASLKENVKNASKGVNESTAKDYTRCVFMSIACCD